MRTKSTHQIVAANDSPIRTYGSQLVTIKINNTDYKFQFIIADITKPIIVSDFLRKFRFAIDIPGKKLINIDHFRYELLSKSTRKPLSLQHISTTNPFENILDEFPDILSFKPEVNEIKQEVKHHIKTDGHPCHSRSRRLSPEKLQIAKSEFKMMEKKGIIQRSKSLWSSPLHMVKKIFRRI